MTTTTICKTCTSRYPACHDRCEKYISEKKQVQAEKDLVRNAKMRDYAYSQYRQDMYYKIAHKKPCARA